MSAKKPLWVPSQQSIENSNMMKFIRYVNSRFVKNFHTYDELYDWSVNDIEEFWKAVWEFGKFKFSEGYSSIMTKDEMINTKWFQGAKLNFAENLLRFKDNRTALIGIRENQEVVKVSYQQLVEKVAVVANYLRSVGVKKGDRVAAFISNVPEAVIGMISSVSLGALWTSCSSEFGAEAAIERFGQVQPRVLFAVDNYSYNGQVFDCSYKIKEICESIKSIEKVLIIPQYNNFSKHLYESINYINYNELPAPSSNQIKFEQVDFVHPLYIMYSSGTTGKPKCIVHGTGGVLIQHFKELYLHTNISENDVITYYTTTGWMMWNWLISSLMLGASVVLIDGSPVYPSQSRLWDLIDEHKISIFGTSPKYLSMCQSNNLIPKINNELTFLKIILSTGSPLTIENFRWVYENVKKDVQLSSISGGTDIISCFMLGNPMLPIYEGEIQCRGLGMKVEVFDDNGQPIYNEKGELVCTKPFPSMPIYFWNDPEMEKYKSSYFEYYPGIWRHGDYIMLTANGGVIVYGRSDATLNPGGVRIGTTEIYNVVEKMDEVADSLAVGQNWNNDVRIILFVVLKDSITLTEHLKEKIKSNIKSKLSPRHVPAKIIQINEVPRTINMKKVEIAVSKLINGLQVENINSIANYDSLKQFENLKELSD